MNNDECHKSFAIESFAIVISHLPLTIAAGTNKSFNLFVQYFGIIINL